MMSVRSARDYAFLNVRMRAQRMELFSAGLYNLLASATDIDNLTQMLNETAYRAIICEEMGEKYINPIIIDRCLIQHYTDQFNHFKQFVPRGAKSFIDAYSRTFFLNNVKTIIQALHGTGSSRFAQELLISLSEEEDAEIESLLHSKDIEDLIERLSDEKVQKVLKDSYEEYQRLALVYPLINAIDHYLTRRISGEINNLSGDDRVNTQMLFGTKFDLQNIETALRSKFFEISPDRVKNWILPEQYRLRDQTIGKLIESSDLESALEVLRDETSYREIANRLLYDIKEERSPLDNYDFYADQIIAHRANEVFLGLSFNIGIFPAFFILKEFEIRNIRTLIFGKIDKRTEKEILEKIVLV